MSACNTLTGANDLVIDSAFADGEQEQQTSSGDVGSTTGHPSGGPSGAGGGSVSGSGGGQLGGGSSTGGPVPDPLVDAAGVTITEIAIYQGVKRPLMAGGGAASGVSIVAGRDALLRVFYEVDGSYSGGEVSARLFLDGAMDPIEVNQTLGGSSTNSNLGSTINFEVPGASLHPGMTYRVELMQDPSQSTGNNPSAHWPASGEEQMDVESSGATLKVVLVPVAYGADGSNRLPDTSQGQLDAYLAGLYAQYPVPAIDLSVRQSVQWNGGISSGGGGWDSLLDAIANLRIDDGVPPDTYYYGIFRPASTFGGYCGGGCVSGLGMLGGPTDSYTRAAIGLGFAGGEAVHTAVHEVGHTHGRQHTPCGGAAGTDGNYPHPGADIGVWGYDLVSGQLFSPDDTKDFMSYCGPSWVSDYTFQALFNRIKFVNGANVSFPPDTLDKTYERARVNADGTLTWWSDLELPTPPMGEPTAITVVSERDSEKITGQFYPYDHLEGGVLVWRKPQRLGTALQIDIGGKLATLVR